MECFVFLFKYYSICYYFRFVFDVCVLVLFNNCVGFGYDFEKELFGLYIKVLLLIFVVLKDLVIVIVDIIFVVIFLFGFYENILVRQMGMFVWGFYIEGVIQFVKV